LGNNPGLGKRAFLFGKDFAEIPPPPFAKGSSEEIQ
jgi:hypothetical protein